MVTPDVCHVCHQVRSDLVGNLTQPLVVPITGVGGPTGDNQLRPEVQSLLLKLVVVQVAGLEGMIQRQQRGWHVQGDRG